MVPFPSLSLVGSPWVMHRFEPKRRQARGHRLFRAMQKGDYAEHVLISLVVTAFLLVRVRTTSDHIQCGGTSERTFHM